MEHETVYLNWFTVHPVYQVISNEASVRRTPDDVQGEPTMYDFMEDSAMVKTDSPFRGSFDRYLNLQVPNAAYLEGMRVAILELDIEKALTIMGPMSTKSPHAALAIPILKICLGDFYLAMNEMFYYWERTKIFKDADTVGATIIKHIAQLGPATNGAFTFKWCYLYVPPCASVAGHRCKRCLLYSYSKMVRGMV